MCSGQSSPSSSKRATSVARASSSSPPMCKRACPVSFQETRSSCATAAWSPSSSSSARLPGWRRCRSTSIGMPCSVPHRVYDRLLGASSMRRRATRRWARPSRRGATAWPAESCVAVARDGPTRRSVALLPRRSSGHRVRLAGGSDAGGLRLPVTVRQ